MKTVFFDVDTQNDFLLPAGALYVPGAELKVDTIAGLSRWAAEHGIPVISTTDAHAENDPEFADWPPHCVAGTLGQHKPAVTLIGEERQTVLQKQTLDCFGTPELEALLKKLGAQRCVVYGAVAEICVRIAALGFLKRGFSVEVVEDAVVGLNGADAAMALSEVQRAGGKLTTVAEVCRG